LAGIGNEETREAAAQSLLAGKSPDSVKMASRYPAAGEEDGQAKLEKEKQRLERTIEALSKRLEEINSELRMKNEE
jgi:hypothetical protein